jgi:predicted nucleic acid-binding protein
VRVLLDTDVLLDVALAREPHAAQSTAVLRWAEAGGDAVVAWHTLANCAYLLKGGGRPFLNRLLRIVEVAPTGTADARRAMELPMADLENAFQAAAALAWRADAIVTRNVRDFHRSPVRALTPSAFLKQTRADLLAVPGGGELGLQPAPRRRKP